MKELTRSLRGLTPVLLSVVVFLMAATAMLVEPSSLTSLRNTVFDSYQRLRPRPYEPSPVRVADIDDQSLAEVGQWPWPRTRLAELVTRLREAGAVAIAADIVFAEPDRTSPEIVLASLTGLPGAAELIGGLPSHDGTFAEAIAGGAVITGFVLTNDAERAGEPEPKAPFVTAGDDPLLFVPAFSGAVTSLPRLEEAATGNGALNFTPGRDGIIRRVQLVYSSRGRLHPALAAEALRVARGGQNYLVKSSGASGESRFGGKTGLVSLRIGDLSTSVDAGGGLWLHYTQPVAERRIPAARLLRGEFGPGSLDGAIVFLGTSAAGLKDLRLDPLGNVIAGAEVHAQAVEQILQGSYLTRPDWAKVLELLACGLICAALVVLVLRVGALWAAVAGIVMGGMAYVISWIAFSQHRLLLDPVIPSIAALGVYLVCSVSRHRQAEGEKRWIQDAFSSYISPNLVDYLVEHPEEMNLGGERRQCSFVMCDLEGFTTLVESSEPAVVVGLLNEYLDGMVRIALEHGGTIDRIVGDAVAVMFSAPVAQEDHAARAVRCALDLDAYATAFMARKQSEGIPVGRTRIGVNSGTVTIGNVGGEAIFDYRALGDAVNTTARLETVNRQIGTHVIVSGATVAACPDFIGRPVGTLVLKGKSEGVDAWEPLGQEEAVGPAAQAYLGAFELLRNHAPEARTAFEALARSAPDDPLVAFHLKRLEQGESGVVIRFGTK